MAYEDLLKDTSVPVENNNYFEVTLTDLDPDQSYPIQFRWKFKDGTFGDWSAVKRVITPVITPEPPVNPSVPTVKPVLGAIELTWNGKTSTGGNQPYGFTYAKVYIGTTSGFTPVDSGPTKNQVDILDFGNGQNVINIGVGTVVNGSLTIDYDTDYYVKIATTNGTLTSSPVSATGNPVQIGKVSSSGIITITADKIATGTLSAGSTITVGNPSGKRVVLSGGSDPIKVYNSGNSAILTFDSLGDLEVTGTIKAKSGYFDGAVSVNGSGGSMKIGKRVDPTETYDGLYLGTNNYWYNDGVFKVGNGTKSISWNGTDLVVTGTINAAAGSIGGWTLSSTNISGTGLSLKSDTGTFGASSIRFGIDDSFAIAYEPVGDNFLIYNVTGNKTALSINETTNVIIAGTSAPVYASDVASKGLRNIFTTTSYTGNTQYSTSAHDGDILVVYTA